MLGKLVLCAVLFVAISQMCHARPQESQDDQLQALTFQRIGTRVTSCRRSLRDIVLTLANLSYDFGRLYAEILAAVIESVKCVLELQVRCGQVVFTDTIDGFREAISDFAQHIVDLGKNLGQGVQTCLLQRS